MAEGVPKNKYEGLTEEDIAVLEEMQKGNEAAQDLEGAHAQMAEFLYNQEFLWRKLKNALNEVVATDPHIFLRLTMAVRAREQTFMDLIKKAESEGANIFEHPDLQARDFASDINGLRFTELFTNSGYGMRAMLIEHLEEIPEAQKVVDILKELQKLLPELEPGEDFGL